jgi:hypothetical protein
VTAATVLLVILAAMVAGADDDARILFLDMYELTGSRLSGLVSVAGVMLLAASAGICLFASRLSRARAGTEGWSRWLLGVGLLTALLAIDDYVSIHEYADDVLMAVTGIDAPRPLKNVLEAGVLGFYGLLVAVLLWRFRPTIALTEWRLLGMAIAMLLASLLLDMAPHAWLDATLGFALHVQELMEETLKFVGIGLWATYLVRSSATAVRGTALAEAHPELPARQPD